jgi:hypothetical protein
MSTAKVITTVGNTKITSNKIVFDGTGDCLTTPDHSDFSFGSTNFTIEAFVTMTNSTGGIIISQWDAGSVRAWALMIDTDRKVYWKYRNDGSNEEMYTDTTLTVGVEAHIAVVYWNAVGYYLYLNGTRQSQVLSPAALSPNVSDVVSIGGRSIAGSVDVGFTGYIRELRVSNTHRWAPPVTPTFTPPTTKYVPDVNTVLLVHGDGPDNTTSFYDHVIPNVVTAYNGAAVSSNQVSFDGTNDYLETADSLDWWFEEEDFTVEFKFTPTNVARTDERILGQYEYVSPGENEWTIIHAGAAFRVIGKVRGVSWIDHTYPYALTNSTQYHVAWVRSGNFCKFFVAGINQGDQAVGGTAPNLAGPIQMGGRNYDVGFDSGFQGKLDEIRISKGIARYTANFTPPSSEFTPDTYTKLLLHCNGTDASTTFRDDRYGMTGTLGITLAPESTYRRTNNTVASANLPLSLSFSSSYRKASHQWSGSIRCILNPTSLVIIRNYKGRRIKDPVVIGGCPQCGTYLYNKGAS